jgi:hypothetical protein
MTIATFRIAPRNSQIVIADPNGKVDVPQWKESMPYLATPSCILFFCLCEIDGETEITLGNSNEVDPGVAPVFDGHLLTPSRTLAIETVVREPILRTATAGVRTKLRIWSDASKGPTKVMVGIE